MSHLELLGTRGCHLCDMAEEVLYRAMAIRPFRFTYVDIAEDSALMESYALRIPVLRRTGHPDLGWPFTETDAIALLD